MATYYSYALRSYDIHIAVHRTFPSVQSTSKCFPSSHLEVSDLSAKLNAKIRVAQVSALRLIGLGKTKPVSRVITFSGQIGAGLLRTHIKTEKYSIIVDPP